MKDFLAKFLYLLDKQDRKNFLRFLILLFVGGILSSLGMAALILAIKGLVNQQFFLQIPVLNRFSYMTVVVFMVLTLIFFLWVKGLTTLIIIKKQNIFLNNIIAKVQKKLFSYYLCSPYNHHIKRSTPELISIINTEVTIFSQVMVKFGILLNETVTSSVLIIIVLVINPIFSIFVLASVILSNQLLMKHTKDKARRYGDLRGMSQTKLAQTATQALQGIKEIKIYQKESFFNQKAAQSADNIAQAAVFFAIHKQWFLFLTEAIPITVALMMIFILLMTGHNGVDLLVSVSVFGIVAAQLLPSVERFMQAIAEIRYSHFSLGKIYEELRRYKQFITPPLIQQDPIIFNDCVSLKNISFAYGNDPVLNSISLTIPKGKKIALVGHSGAGKTTLVDIILGILPPVSGEIWIDQTRLTTNNLPGWYSHFGYIPQMIYIYDCSIRENIALGIDLEQIEDDKIWHCLEIASLAEFVKEQCPQGLDTLVGENGIRLSGGQRQRIGIARALYNNPDILVMDEATAALDNQTEYEVSQALSNASRNCTIITIAHRLTTIQHYDIIYVMETGKLLASGSYQELLTHCQAFREMVHPKRLNLSVI